MGILSQKFPDAEFEYKYADEDLGNNTGKFVFKEGSILYGNFYKDQSVSSYKTCLDCMDWLNSDKYKILVGREEDARLVYCPVERL